MALAGALAMKKKQREEVDPPADLKPKVKKEKKHADEEKAKGAKKAPVLKTEPKRPALGNRPPRGPLSTYVD